MKRTISKLDIILAAISLAICNAFLCLSIKKVVEDNASWTGGIWIFGFLIIYESVLIILMARHLKNTKK